MSNAIEQLQVLYEIAMSIGSSLDLHPMLKNSLAVLLKKLNCSAGGVLFFRPGPISSLELNDSQEIHFEEIFNIPRRISNNKAYQSAIRRLPKTIPANRVDVFLKHLPLSGQEEPGNYFYILELPDIGLLILTKYGDELDSVILKSLKLLSNKLADACKACLQNAELSESEEKYRRIVDTANEGIWVVDENKLTNFVNTRMAEMLGYQPEEMIGWELKSFVIKEDFLDYDKKMENRRNGVTEQYERRWRSKDEKIVWTIVSETPLFDSEHKFRGSFAMITNIAERKAAEETQQHERLLLRTLINHLPVAVWAKDKNYCRTIVNPAYVHGVNLSTGNPSLSDADLIGTTDFDVYPKNEAESYLAEEEKIIKEGHAIIGEERSGLGLDGKKHWQLTSKVPLQDENGEIIGLVGLSTDITDLKQTEEALRLSENQYRNLFEQANEAILIFEPSKEIILEANSKACEIHGYTREEFIGMSLKDVSKDADRGTLAIDQVLAYNNLKGFESIHRRKDGAEIHFLINASVIEYNGVKAILSISRDITERKRAEELLKQSESQYRLLADHMKDTVWLMDMNLKTIYISPSVEKLRGYTLEEIQQLPLDRQLAPVSYQAAMNAILEEIPRALADPTYNFSRTLELEFYRKDGATYWSENSFNLIRDENGTPLSILGEGRDITDRKRAEEALREKEKQFRRVVEHINDALIVDDAAGNILFANNQFLSLFGFVREELPSLKIEDCAAPEYRAELQGRYEKQLPTHFEFEGIRRDGQRRWLEVGVVPVIGDNGSVMGTQSTMRDITEKKKLEKEFLQMQRMESMGTLAGGVAHDFNNILGIIMGHSSLLSRSEYNSSKFSRSINAIMKAAERGAALSKQLLTFARKTDVVFEPTIVNEIIIELIKLLHETFQKTIVVVTELENNIPPVIADTTQLHQVLLNLCVNARDAMPMGGTLAITTTKVNLDNVAIKHPQATSSEYVLLRVADTGIGMNEKTSQKIFEPFFTTKGPGKGTGLGLALVYGIIETHNGFIDVESEPGKGTTFDIYLPVQSGKIAQQDEENKSEQDAPGGNETILLIEDEEMLCEFLKDVLAAKGYNILTAQDGEEGLAVYASLQEEINIVICDIGLPKYSGSEVLARIKAINPKAKVIFASGFIEPNLKSELYKAGAKYFIQKPYSANDVLKIIRKIIDME